MENLQTTPIENILNVTWDIPKEVESCVSTYKLVWWNQNNNQKDDSTANKYLEISPIVSCMQYTIQVTPYVNESTPGIDEKVEYNAPNKRKKKFK